MKNFYFSLLVLVCSFLTSTRMVADTFTQDGIVYTLNDDGQSYTLTDGMQQSQENVVVPGIVNGYPVTAIGYRAFRGDNSAVQITKITIPASIQSLGQQAFVNCYSLKTVMFEKGSQLKTIANGVFGQCWKLEVIFIPAAIETIGENAFNGCHGLKKVIFENGSKLKSIANFAFNNTEAMTEMNLEECTLLESIGQNGLAFNNTPDWGSNKIESIVIPGNVKSLVRRCLSGLTQMKAILFVGKKDYSAYQNVDDLFGSDTGGTVYYNKDYSFPSTISNPSSTIAPLPTIGVENPVGLVKVGDALYATHAQLTSAVNYSKTAGLTAYKAVYNAAKSVIVLTPVTSVGKGEPVVLKADVKAFYVLTGDESAPGSLTDNDLRVSDGSVTGDGTTIWALASKEEGVGFYPVANGINVPYGKAYMVIKDAAFSKCIPMTEATAAVRSAKVENAPHRETLFNIAGQHVTKNYHGVVISNGKKYLNK